MKIGETSIITTPHCRNCGELNPALASCACCSACCGKSVCTGDAAPLGKYGKPERFVVACCWGAAEHEYERLGLIAGEGSWRIGDAA